MWKHGGGATMKDLPEQQPVIINPGFEAGNLSGWEGWWIRNAQITTNAFSGNHAVQFRNRIDFNVWNRPMGKTINRVLL